MHNSKLNSLKIISLLEKNNFKGSVVSINRIRELKSRLDDLYSQRLLDETFFEERLNIFDFDISNILTKAKSIIITTTIQPIVKVEFHYRGTAHKVIVPPTYSNITDKRANKLLRKILEPEDFTLTRVQLPEKLLLVMSGIGKYGKNYIAYVDGMGSFHRPAAFVTDANLDEIKWENPGLNQKCFKCTACIKSCPTGAISKNNFLISAEKCLTYYNERSHSFPEWINPEWHNCIIGCMICQNICPLNKKHLDNTENSVTFSENETLQVLDKVSVNNLSRRTIDKLKKISLFDDYNLLSRNLSVLVNRTN
jgi:epoxyqueuosine reductase